MVFSLKIIIEIIKKSDDYLRWTLGNFVFEICQKHDVLLPSCCKIYSCSIRRPYLHCLAHRKKVLDKRMFYNYTFRSLCFLTFSNVFRNPFLDCTKNYTKTVTTFYNVVIKISCRFATEQYERENTEIS